MPTQSAESAEVRGPSRIRVVQGGTVTSPQGFLAGAVYCGLKTPAPGVLDLGALVAREECVAAALFTRNQVQAAPVLVSREHVADGRAQAVVINSGCANAFTGEEGLADAREMASLCAARFGLKPENVLVASTGIIGRRLAMDKVRHGIQQLEVSAEGGHELARAIMTTDTHPKEVAASFQLHGREVRIGGIAKGAGMIHPDLATMIVVLTTDAALEPTTVQRALQYSVDRSFQMITIDGDTSTNDTVALLASGQAGNPLIAADTAEATAFRDALKVVCVYLAKQIAADGEGAGRLIEVQVERAASLEDARRAARTIAGSLLVKAAVHGSDANWGRIVAAAGRSGARMNPARLHLHLGPVCLVRQGRPCEYDEAAARALLSQAEVVFRLDLAEGSASATAWGCDLSPEYVTINSAYST